MFYIMKNTFTLLFRKKSLIISLIIAPTLLTLFLSFTLSMDSTYGVGVVNNDTGTLSKELLNKVEAMGSPKLINLKESEIDRALVGKTVELVLIFDSNFSNNILEGRDTTIDVKSIGGSEIKGSITSLLNQSTSQLVALGKLSKGNIDTFNTLLNDFENNSAHYSINEESKATHNVASSIGMVIMMIFISSFFISKFIIEDHEGGTKDRILLANISKLKYYSGTLLVFFLTSSITSILYYSICNILGFSFGTDKSIYFLITLLTVNFLALTFNLAIVAFTKTPTLASNISTLLIISSCMLGGVFWPFTSMPEAIQTIGNLIPLRWAMDAFETLQKGGSFGDIASNLILIVVFGMLLLSLSVLVPNKKSSN